MNDKKTLLDALRKLKVETGSLACLGCGYEHNCSTQGCAILRKAELVVECSLVHQCRNCDFYEGGLGSRCFNKKSICVGRTMRPEDGCDHCSIDLLTESEKARSDLAKRLALAQQERDLAVRRLSEIRDCDDCIHDNDIPCDACKAAIGFAVCTAADSCPCRNCTMENNWEQWEWNGSRSEAPMTNGDRFRRYTDEELVELLYQDYLNFSDRDGAADPSTKWCDMKGGCQGEETSECTTELHKACIIRWLKSEAVEG